MYDVKTMASSLSDVAHANGNLELVAVHDDAQALQA